jgi:hypothetical protein
VKFNDKVSWGEKLLPKWKGVEWTRGRLLLLTFALSLFVDSFLVPFSRDVDPGRAGDGMLFLILGFRAASRSELPLSVIIAGGCLTALTLFLNHVVQKAPSFVWAPIAILLLAFVMFWGRGKRGKSNSDEVKGEG